MSIRGNNWIVGIVATVVLSGCSETTSSGQKTTETVTPAESACLAAVEKETGVSGVSTISVSPSEAATTVMVKVPGAEAPWKCNSDSDGNVAEVTYTAEG